MLRRSGCTILACLGTINLLGCASRHPADHAHDAGPTHTPAQSHDARAFHRPAGTGRAYFGPGDLYTMLATGDETNNAYFQFEAIVPPGGGPPAHIHSGEDESFYLAEGSLEMQLGDKIIIVNAGDFVNVPRGTAHRFKNIGTRTAKLVVTFVPAGMEKYFEAVFPVATDRSATPPPITPALIEKMTAEAPKHRIEFIPPEGEMAAAAAAFLKSLTPELRAKASLAFQAESREDWHYVPRKRAGVELGELSDAQKMAARALMRSALSSQGMNKVEEIMLLDSVLREMEKGSGPRRDSLAYSIAVFGEPGSGPWGWKVEGHHVSLNFTGVGEKLAVTPSFLGANPAEVRQGDRAGVRLLAWEEDLGRELLASLRPDQRRDAVIGEKAPPDILAVPGRSLDEIDSVGLAVSSMDAAQRTLVERLIAEYAGNLRHKFADRESERIRAAGIEKVRFAWMGSDVRGEGHYYRLSGPTFVIEYDNTQNGANHIHTVWRDRERDFGRDLLKEHLEREHPHGAK